MSRTYKDDVRHSYSRHPHDPFWKYRWYLRHGSKSSSAKIRRVYNQRDRSRMVQALREGREPAPVRKYLTYIYW